MTDISRPSPELFFRTLWAYQQTAVLRAAIDLDVFSAIATGAATADEIGGAIQASSRGTRMLCDYLAMLGFLVKVAFVLEAAADVAVVVFVLAGLAGGFFAGNARKRDVCSEPACERVLPEDATVCGHCGGIIAGRIRRASERLAAEERLPPDWRDA